MSNRSSPVAHSLISAAILVVGVLLISYTTASHHKRSLPINKKQTPSNEIDSTDKILQHGLHGSTELFRSNNLKSKRVAERVVAFKNEQDNQALLKAIFRPSKLRQNKWTKAKSALLRLRGLTKPEVVGKNFNGRTSRYRQRIFGDHQQPMNLG